MEKTFKISDVLVKSAGDFIRMGSDFEEKQQNLNLAVNCWNIACLDKKDRIKATDEYIKLYKEVNTGWDEDSISDLKFNMNLLIKINTDRFPFLKIFIVDGIVEDLGNNQMQIMAAHY